VVLHRESCAPATASPCLRTGGTWSWNLDWCRSHTKRRWGGSAISSATMGGTWGGWVHLKRERQLGWIHFRGRWCLEVLPWQLRLALISPARRTGGTWSWIHQWRRQRRGLVISSMATGGSWGSLGPPQHAMGPPQEATTARRDPLQRVAATGDSPQREVTMLWRAAVATGEMAMVEGL
jgi:hypothetical protein